MLWWTFLGMEREGEGGRGRDSAAVPWGGFREMTVTRTAGCRPSFSRAAVLLTRQATALNKDSVLTSGFSAEL